MKRRNSQVILLFKNFLIPLEIKIRVEAVEEVNKEHQENRN